ncbi:heavy metal sensor histidine kinase [Burkholderia alba]|uniref:heavy metal sensor histidine kinase n=1 Tax=Burkholderia alba TaxID=2683677 RepID=UPI002B0572AB|nr:heavy metal sensor histidine kinase [Burkholderia alba]
MKRAGRPYSLLIRLTVAFAVPAFVVFAVMGAFLYDSLSTELRRRDDLEIEGKLAQFIELVHEAGSIDAIRGSQQLFRDVLMSHPGVYLAICDASNDALVSDVGPRLPMAKLMSEASRGGIPVQCDLAQVGDARCILGRERLPSGETVHVAVVRAAKERHALLQSYYKTIVCTVGLGALFVGLLGYLVVRRGMQPVESIGRQISQIEAHSLGERLDLEGGPQELHEIATAVNRMLDRLERAFVRLSQFSSELAHDMRTPLANMISASQVTLGRRRSADEYETLIGSNIEECERMQRMIENMLFLARTDNATQAMQVAPLDAGAELRRFADYFHDMADECGKTIVAAGDATLQADPLLFRRALNNLIANALEHAEPGSAIELAAVRRACGVDVSVANRGATIPPEHIDKIFERFYRADAARHGAAQNAGLGLAIVASIMTLHHGSVDVSSAAGRTVFTLHFPDERPA